MMAHLGDTTSQAVAKLWRAPDFLRRRVRMPPEREHAE